MRVLADVLQFWKDTWKEHKLLFFAEMIGTLCALSSAGILSFASGSYLEIIFISYIISNLAFIYAAYHRKSSWILVMSLGFLILNVIGIFKILI